jgi:hypothetical protein
MRRANFNSFTRYTPPRPLTVEPPDDPAEKMSAAELIACAVMVAKGLAIDTVEARAMRLRAVAK